MRHLHFTEAGAGERIRELCWRRKSLVPLEPVYDTANAVRDALTPELGTIDVSVHEPIATDPPLLAALLAEAEVFDVRAQRTRAWLFIDTCAARTLVAALFGAERPAEYRPWTALEREVLTRIMRDVAFGCRSLLGEVSAVGDQGDIRSALNAGSMIALRLGPPVACEIDLLLAADPPASGGAYPSTAVIEELSLAVQAVAGKIKLRISELGALQIGAVLPMSKEGPAYLAAARTILAYGTCGITADRLAFKIAACNESLGA